MRERERLQTDRGARKRNKIWKQEMETSLKEAIIQREACLCQKYLQKLPGSVQINYETRRVREATQR